MLSRSAGARNVCLSGREEGIDSYSGPLAASAPTSLRPYRILTVSLQNFNPPSDVLFSKRYQEERERDFWNALHAYSLFPSRVWGLQARLRN